MKPIVTVTGLDHIVLHCADIETTLTWYINNLGLTPVRVDEWRNGAAPFPSLRVDPTTIIDLIPGTTPAGRLDHICFTITPTDLAAVRAAGTIHIAEPPAERYGAQGHGTSIYTHDPDGTTIELRHYGRDRKF